MRLPGFFIVGAPKSGTSALHEFLRQHPGIFMPAFKEIHFFGSDLDWPRRPNRSEYLRCFADWRAEAIAGETSVYYLLSQRAAGEIRRFNPEARVIVMLRNPVDAIHSLYHQVRFNLHEDIDDFEAALAAEPRRALGLDFPAPGAKRQQLLYRETVRYAGQVSRYFDTFGRDRVHVIVYDDFLGEPRRIYREVLQFLGVDAGFAARIAQVNASKVYRSRRLQSVLAHPPAWLARALRQVLPPVALRQAASKLYRINARPQAHPPMDTALREKLVAEFRPEVDRLESLLGRDLDQWKWPPAAPPDQAVDATQSQAGREDT